MTRYWMEQGYDMTPGPMPMSVETGHVVMATDFAACAQAAVDMARAVQDALLEGSEGLGPEHPAYLRAQAVIEQYREKR